MSDNLEAELDAAVAKALTTGSYHPPGCDCQVCLGVTSNASPALKLPIGVKFGYHSRTVPTTARPERYLRSIINRHK